MSHPDEIPSLPRPARMPSLTAVEAVDAVPPAPLARPKKRSEVMAAGALFVLLLGVMTLASCAVMFVMFG
jgi:hypothetical protein